MFHLVFICCACVEHVLIIDELLCYGMFDGHYHQDTQASNNSLKIDNYVHFCPIDFREINNIHRHNPLIIFMFDVPYPSINFWSATVNWTLRTCYPLAFVMYIWRLHWGKIKAFGFIVFGKIHCKIEFVRKLWLKGLMAYQIKWERELECSVFMDISKDVHLVEIF